MVENDNEVSAGWLELLIRACDEEQADVARPMILERMIIGTYPHFDPRLGHIEKTAGPDGDTFKIMRRTKPLAKDLRAKRQKTTVLEVHCVLFRRSVFDRIGLFDERVTTRQEVDLALQLCAANVPVIFEPAAQVTYHRPPPVYRDEREYFYRRWNLHSAITSHEVINQKWNLTNLPSSIDFARNRRHFVSYSRYMAYYARHELGPYIRWELGPKLRYAAFRSTNLLPNRLGEPLRRALYR
jgi:GT2 family glycosyltransferase